MKEEIKVIKNYSRNVGGCNACTTHIDVNGMIPHEVVEVQLRSLVFRLCDDCRKELIKKLSDIGYAKSVKYL